MSFAMAFVDMFPEQKKPYLKIIRMHDPTLNVMVFWPTAWCIELSNTSDSPNVYLLTLFFLESFILHGAGLILNDIFDRSIDSISCSFSVLISRVAVTGGLDWSISVLFLAGVLYWTVSYTIYNSQDKHIDKRIGVKSAALKFGNLTKIWLWSTSLVFVISLVITGYIFQQTLPYFVSLLVSYAMISHKIACVDLNDPESCFKYYSFSSVGLVILLGILAGNIFKQQQVLSESV